MKFFGLVVLICIFQPIRFSFACFGHTIDLLQFVSGPKNNVKFEDDVHFELTDNCTAIGSAHVTMERPFTSALVSLKVIYNEMEIFSIKNVDLCKFLINYDVAGLNCSSVEVGRRLIAFGENMNISEYGPFLGLFVGNLTLLLKAYFDGDEHNPDIFALVVNIRRIDESSLRL